jgi:hypothetical protein
LSADYKLGRSGNSVYLVFGFVLFWLGLFVSHALIELVIHGSEYDVNVLLLFGGVYYLSAIVYFLFSALIAASCFGYFCYYLARDLKGRNIEKFSEFVKDVIKNSEERVKEYVEKKFAQVSMGQFTLSENIEVVKNRMGENFEKMKDALGDLNVYKEVLDRQTSALNDSKKMIKDINMRLAPKPFLTVSSDVGKVVGVGKKTAMAFRNAGIGRVQELIAEEAKAIAEKTMLSESSVVKVQAAAKMLIVPGISLKVVKSLKKVDVYSLEELASQNPIELYRRVVAVAGKEKLSLEEIAFCVRAAQCYVSKNLGIYAPYVVAYPESLTQTKRAR